MKQGFEERQIARAKVIFGARLPSWAAGGNMVETDERGVTDGFEHVSGDLGHFDFPRISTSELEISLPPPFQTRPPFVSEVIPLVVPRDTVLRNWQGQFGATRTPLSPAPSMAFSTMPVRFASSTNSASLA